MDQLVIKGPAKLKGEVSISLSKNAALPIMTTCLLSGEGVTTLTNLPNLRDINTMKRLLENLGVKTNQEGKSTTFDAKNISSREANYELVKTMRASILVLGPLLARFNEATVSLPGGCAIGTRPIDIHLAGFEKLGAKIDLQAGYVKATCQGLKGDRIVLPFPSVGATENLMMAACLAKGETVIENAAKEPEIVDLENILKKMGAKIEGAGSHLIRIQGVDSLKAVEYEPISDRIEAITFIIAALVTNSEITINNTNASFYDAVTDVLVKMGANLEIGDNFIRVKEHQGLKGVTVDTAPYPGFPTDAQAQLMALACVAKSSSVITEHIFENRFMHVPELARMGAKIVLKGHTAMVEGNSQLLGAPVMCTDLRASAALILAALAAEGETRIQRVYHLDRGYDGIDQKLLNLGVQIKRVAGPNL